MRDNSCPVLLNSPRLRSLVLALAAVSAGIARGAESEEFKDHVFFLGLDVFVLQPEGLLPVEGFNRGCVNVDTEQGKRVVPLKNLADIDTKIEPKVSTTNVFVSGMEGYRSYTPSNDPRLNAVRTESRLVAEQMQMESMSAIAESRVLTAETNMNAAMPANTTPAQQAEIRASRQSELNSAQAKLHQANIGQTIDSYDPLLDINDLDQSTADAYAVQFELTSEEVIEDGYAVLVTNVILPGDGVKIRAVEFSRLPVIDENPRRIQLVQSPLPVGFQVDGNEVHVYRPDGREVATNLSQKRVELTKSEAFDFLLFRYVSTHKLANLPPRVVRELLPAELGIYIPQDQLERTVRIGVDEKGAVSSVYLEGGSSGGSDEFLAKAIHGVYFFPALAFGEPVETSTTLQLAEFVQ